MEKKVVADKRDDDTFCEQGILVRGLTKSFGKKIVLDQCTLNVDKGTVYGLLGKNGAGKTTLFKLLLGLLKPDAGCIQIFGRKVDKDCQWILRHTGSIIEMPVFYEHLSARENLRIHLAYMGLSEDTGIEQTLKMAGLKDVGNSPVRSFSLGMRQRLAIARALIHKPRLLILDEPVNGLDPAGIRDMRILFRNLIDSQGMTILMSSHLVSEILQVADRIGVISDGAMVMEMDTQELSPNHTRDLEDFLITAMEGGRGYDETDRS